MPTYAYVVKDKAGKTHSGTLETESRNRLIEQLWKQEFVIISIDERQAGRSSMLKVGQPKVAQAQLVIFARQLATMVDSGIPIVSALDVLAEQLEDKNFQRTLQKIRDDVEAGASLSEACSRHPRVFSNFFFNMVRAGESSGRLDEILDRVATYIEKAEGLQRKVKASLFYPAFVSFMAFGITTFLVVVIVPKFKEIFTALGGELPLPTQLLLGLSDLMRKYLVIEVVLGFLLVVAFRLYINTPNGRRWYDGTMLKLPLIGKLLQKAVIARFARTLATLVRSGVPILSSLDIVARTSGNKVVEDAVTSARSSIKEGENIADPLAASKVFPPMVTRMISVGEKTGELEKMLSKIADFYESEVDAAVTGLTSLIEPMVIAFLGVVIGGIVIALFLPVFKISTLVAK
jgi:type IV pilus assembly protein PilC